MVIAIASTRGPKVEADKHVVNSIKHLLPHHSSDICYLAHEIDGGVSMPRTIDELLSGALQRVIALQQTLSSIQQHADYFIGMEGGFHSLTQNGHTLVFLQSWAYVSNGKLGYYGSSGNVLVPDIIAQEVMKNGRDLSEVIDEVAEQRDVRSKQGTWGILTKDLLTRQESFEIALKAAFAPFYNAKLYS